MAKMTADTFINNMLGELMYQIVNGHEALPKEQQQNLKEKTPFKDANFFTWCTPGIPVVPEDFAFLKGLRKPLDPEKFKDLPENEKEEKKGDAAYLSTMAMDNFSLLVDTVPAKSGAMNSLQVWEPQERISHIYDSVLKSCEVADTETSPEIQERIQKIRSSLVETSERTDADTGEKFTEERPTKMVAAYNKYMLEYTNAYGTYVDLMSKALSGNAADVQRASMMGPKYYAAVTAAYDMWVSSGYKTAYEKAVADLEQLEGQSMSQLIKEYRQIFAKSQRESLLDGSLYSVARLVPASFYESEGWSSYKFSSSQLKTSDRTKSQKYSGGARYGFFGGAKGSYENLDSAGSINFEKFEVEMELCQVPLFTNGIVKSLFSSNKWRFKTQQDEGSLIQPGDILSNGNPENPEGKLFAYPTVIIFAKNIKVTKEIYDQMSAASQRSRSGSGGFSLGPLSLGAKGSYNTTEKSLSVNQIGDKMEVQGMQIVGFRNHIVPLCPNPDPSITKWI